MYFPHLKFEINHYISLINQGKQATRIGSNWDIEGQCFKYGRIAAKHWDSRDSKTKALIQCLLRQTTQALSGGLNIAPTISMAETQYALVSFMPYIYGKTLRRQEDETAENYLDWFITKLGKSGTEKLIYDIKTAKEKFGLLCEGNASNYIRTYKGLIALIDMWSTDKNAREYYNTRCYNLDNPYNSDVTNVFLDNIFLDIKKEIRQNTGDNSRILQMFGEIVSNVESGFKKYKPTETEQARMHQYADLLTGKKNTQKVICSTGQFKLY